MNVGTGEVFGILGRLAGAKSLYERGNNTRATGYKTYDQPVVGTSRPARTSLRNILRRHVTKIRSLNIFMAKMLHILLRNISIANLFRHVQFRKLFTFEILYENKIANLSIQLPQ